jgi:hypothetical protein
MTDCPKPYYCYDYDPYPSETSCDNKEYYLAGISAIGLLQCGVTVTDPSDAVELQELIDAGELIIIKGIKGGIDEPSLVQIDALTACGGQLTITADRTVSFVDGKVSKDIVEWYNTMKQNSYGGALLFECAEDRVSFVDVRVDMTANRSMGQLNNEAQVINGSLSWRSLADPVPYDAPAGIFD